jgi:hypothetical protein
MFKRKGGFLLSDVIIISVGFRKFFEEAHHKIVLFSYKYPLSYSLWGRYSMREGRANG